MISASPFTRKICENEIFVKVNGKLNQNFLLAYFPERDA